MTRGVFDRLAEHYDAWFDSARGAALFRAEVQCLERIMPADRSEWLEVGVGSGRFAQALGISEGVDPSPSLLGMARARAIKGIEGIAEDLPYGGDSLEGILLVVTLCFLDDPERAMHEFARVLRPGGRLAMGFVPADSAWGRHYMRKAREGHPFYSVARFYTCSQALDMATKAGFHMVRAASALPTRPDEESAELPIRDGIVPGWGFVGLSFVLEGVGADRGRGGVSH